VRLCCLVLLSGALAEFAPITLAPDASVHALWRIPISAADVRILTAPDVIPQLPYVVALALLTVSTQLLLRRTNAARSA
jgi:hypothetical protein